jgi:hypothetical protein
MGLFYCLPWNSLLLLSLNIVFSTGAADDIYSNVHCYKDTGSVG